MLKLLREYPMVFRCCGRMIPPLKHLPISLKYTYLQTEAASGDFKADNAEATEETTKASKVSKASKAHHKEQNHVSPVEAQEEAESEAEDEIDNTLDSPSSISKSSELDATIPEEAEDIEPEEEPVDIRDVYVVRTIQEARNAMMVLEDAVMKNPLKVFGCDTEVMGINVLKQSPRGHGSVICFSVYGGEDVVFDRKSGIDQTLLWVDTLGEDMLTSEGESEHAKQLFDVFKEFFENEKFEKIWHNYGFDRHVMKRMSINCQGFAGDTMHLGRLWDSSRKGKGYSLEALSTAKELHPDQESKKTSMKTLFGRRKLKKDGSEGRAIMLDPVEIIQHEQTDKWIHYSARDAKATYVLYHKLKEILMNSERFSCYMDASIRESYPTIDTLWDFYTQIWRPFGELLTEMEDIGFYVNVEHLKQAEEQATIDKECATELFRHWLKTTVKMENADAFNPASDAQIRMLLFGGVKNRKNGKPVETFRNVKVGNPEYVIHKQEKRTGRAPRKMMDVTLKSLWDEDNCPLMPEIWTAAGWPAVSASALRVLSGTPGAARKVLEEEYGEHQEIKFTEDSIYDVISPEDVSTDEHMVVFPEEKTQTVMPTDDEIAYNRSLQAQKNGLGPLYLAFHDHKSGLEACRAVEALIEMNAIDTLLTSFIIPLQGSDIKAEDDRIHCSMNINTETGRLSCRRPNLQNQPALEKDRYKAMRWFFKKGAPLLLQVRESFRAESGHTLIVADYGQLELRILAHLTNCKSMLDAFEIGGDFHSRTAMDMYDHIQKEVDAGKVALEPGVGEEDLPLVKDVFSSERRKAKGLNFSIAYGKTAHGLSKDWKVSQSEAEDTLNRWYADRHEVREWQRRTILEGRKRGYVTTLLGRRRNLPELRSNVKHLRSRAERASINTPIQGSAADIATIAMIAIRNNSRLKELGWRMLSQVHDEIILEGPKDSADEALKLVVQCMESPFPSPDGSGYHNPLRVRLTSDAKQADTWYGAK